jgi:hypothetical protein
MTQENARRNSLPTRADLGPTSETLAKVLAELRDITQQAEAADPTYRPLQPKSATVLGRGAGPEKIKWPARVAVGGGALILAGALAVPLSSTLFPDNSGRNATDVASAIADRPNGAPAAPGVLSQQEMASLLRPQEPPPLPNPDLQHAVASADAKGPMSTSSIAPQAAPVARPAAPVLLPPVALPEPLPAADLALAPPPVEETKLEVKAEIARPEPMAQPARAPQAPTAASPSAGTRIASLGDVAVPSPATRLSDPQAAALLVRAQELVQNRDIVSARLILEKASSGGNAEAAFRLAETYDPEILAGWNVLGINGDPVRARELYAKASQAGVPAARDRLASMKDDSR